MVTCPVCGKQNPPGVEYCEECGAALAGQAAGVPATATGSTPGPADGAGAPPSSEAPSVEAPAASESSSVATPTQLPTAVPTSSPGTLLPETGTPAGTAAPGTGRARLVAKRYGAETGEEIPLQGNEIVVGRFDPETGPVDLDLSSAPEAAQISRHHAQIYREADGQWYVKDLGSTNGVFVKAPGSATFGPRVTVPVAIPPGGELAFGNARFVFRMD